MIGLKQSQIANIAYLNYTPAANHRHRLVEYIHEILNPRKVLDRGVENYQIKTLRSKAIQLIRQALLQFDMIKISRFHLSSQHSNHILGEIRGYIPFTLRCNIE